MDLPNELLLRIGRCLRRIPQFGSNKDLVNFSAAHSRFWGPAQEVLLEKPSCHLFNVGHLLRTYTKYPNLANKVRSLEITSFRLGEPLDSIKLWVEFGEGHILPNIYSEHDDSSLLNISSRTRLGKYVSRAIRSSNTSDDNKAQWFKDLKTIECRTAYFSLLLLALPNLKELLLGPNPREFFPWLQAVVLTNGFNRGYYKGHYPGYMVDIFRSLAPKIESLELPLYYGKGVSFTGPDNVWYSDYSRLPYFSSLRRLTIDEDFLMGWRNRDPVEVFPPRLECLIINDSLGRVDELVSRTIKAKNVAFPTLKEMRFYCFPYHIHDGSDKEWVVRMAKIEEAANKMGISTTSFIARESFGTRRIFDMAWVHNQPWRYDLEDLKDLNDKVNWKHRETFGKEERYEWGY